MRVAAAACMTPAHTLLEYDTTLIGSDGRSYAARSCGAQRDDGMWEGWIEFDSKDGAMTLRTTRETTQPNHGDLVYWATGVSAVYLDGALSRAMEPAEPAAEVVVAEPGPPAAGTGDPVLDPHSIYATKGELMLREQLGALAAWHLRTIARACCGLKASTVDALEKLELIEWIVRVVATRAHAYAPAAEAPASH